MLDKIVVRGLRLSTCIGLDRWGKPRPQPVILNISIGTSVDRASLTDDVQDTIDYSTVTKDILSLCSSMIYPNLLLLVDAVANQVLGCAGVTQVSLEAEALNQFRLARSLVVSTVRDCRTDIAPPLEVKFTIKELSMPIIIGVNHIERQYKQNVITTITFHECYGAVIQESLSWGMISEELEKTIGQATYLTLEAFVRTVAISALRLVQVETVTVYAEKPIALINAEASGVEITRHRSQFSASELADRTEIN